MNLFVKTLYTGELRTTTVESYMDNALEPDTQDNDELEIAQQRSQNTKLAFARLCESLASKGLLNEEELAYIADESTLSKLLFTEPKA